MKDGLLPVLCIGESKAEYEAGLNQKVCGDQLTKNLEGVSAEEMLKVAIACKPHLLPPSDMCADGTLWLIIDEPVWAIGTGLVCPKEVAQDVHKFIRSFIASKYGNDVARKVIIQDGGSVNANNVKELMAMPDIDGALVGGASLVADGFSKIVGFQH